MREQRRIEPKHGKGDGTVSTSDKQLKLIKLSRMQLRCLVAM
jgi:hypothetical protein